MGESPLGIERRSVAGNVLKLDTDCELDLTGTFRGTTLELSPREGRGWNGSTGLYHPPARCGPRSSHGALTPLCLQVTHVWVPSSSPRASHTTAPGQRAKETKCSLGEVLTGNPCVDWLLWQGQD